MRKFIYCIMFGLLLAMGWTNDAQAQSLPAEAPVKQFMKAAVKPQPIMLESAKSIGSGVRTHSHSTVMPQRLGTQANAPQRAGQELDMKSISKADADAITYTWTDAEGSHTSKATDVATKPEQMYALLREVYTNKNFPGPYYSAYTMNDERERKVYYGAVEGGWNITGAELSGGITNSVTIPTTSSKTVAEGTSTASGYTYLPIYGMNYDYNQKNQLIYTASQLGLQAGTKITSITFYPRNGITFSGGNVKLSLGNTTTSTFSSTSLITASDLTQVAETGSITANSSLTEWTITFDQPFTYTGNNLLVQLETTAGTWGRNSSFYGVQLGTNVYQSIYSYGTNNPSRSRFLPQATFGYTTERVIQYDPTYQVGEINITASGYNVLYRSITVYDENNNVLTSWDANGSYTSVVYEGTTYEIFDLPFGWDSEYSLFRWSTTNNNTTYNYGYLGGENEPGTITIPNYLLAGHSSVRLVITATSDDDGQSITVNDFNPTSVDVSTYTGTSYEWTINAKSYAHTEYDPDYYKPNQEGYTVLIVAVKNHTTPEENYNYDFDNAYYETPNEIIEYLANNVDSIKLLTDGMRIGEGSDYTIGTLFNAEGTYNKFFFLGKGQARQKPDVVIEREILNQHLCGELVPFRHMFEQFSPTTGASGDETTDFYSKMMEGNVYPVIHDCRSVIELGHQFSMSGNEGETPYAMTGMNFFIPDYRLKYWTDVFTIDYEGTTYGPYNVDGRITNAYQSESTDGNPSFNPMLQLWNASNYSFWYAQYNQNYAPKVGLYKITLEAEAEPRTDIALTQEPGNKNYKVTLTWVSSLNEMTGHEVPQTYTVYYWDPETGERKYLVVEGYTTVDGETGQTSLVYYVEQFSYSYTIDYIVYGSPDDAEHDQFVAVSNIDGVVIPGWDDFVGLELDHHESDFDVADMANYYRNFLTVVNEDIYNGLTVSNITGYNADDPTTPLPQMRQFNLYRWAIKEGVAQPEEKVATITFDQVYADRVHYTITYEDNQDILESKYERAAMDIPDEGWIRVKGNGDLVIWPNGYFVNFKSIIIKNGNDVLYEWYSSSANVDTDNPNLPNGWETSPGSKMMPYIVTSSGEKVCYMEGGGYIYIPNMLNNPAYTNLTVEIVAYTDGGHVGRIEVNDKSQSVTNVATTYTWGTTENPISPAAAPRHDEKDNPSKSVKDVNSKASINN
jgi:hypothetical protein